MPIRFRRVLVASGALTLAVATAQAQAPEALEQRSLSQDRERLEQAGPSETGAPARIEQQMQKEARRTYTVQRGDTLSSIASRHGVSVRELAQENGIQNVNRIRRGQELAIPGQGQGQGQALGQGQGQALGQGQGQAQGQAQRALEQVQEQDQVRERIREHQPATPDVGGGPPAGSGRGAAPGKSEDGGADAGSPGGRSDERGGGGGGRGR